MLSLSRNVYIIALIMSLSFTSVSMMVLVAGLLGVAIAPTPELATLPAAIMIVGTAVATIPAALIMQKIGRKAGMAVGLCLALVGTACAYQAAMSANFSLFIVGSLLIGFNAAFTQQGRFIIMENSDTPQKLADGISLALMANLFAAIVGPLIGAQGKNLISSQGGFAGSFVMSGTILLFALVALTFFSNTKTDQSVQNKPKRPLRTIAKQPLFIVSVGSAAFGYGVMALIMTATPISMHEMSGHSLEHTTFVIQSHIVAMFLPSLLSGYLIKKGLNFSLIITGLVAYLIVAAIGISGVSVPHYWVALVLLGLGWNFLFVTSTTLLPNTYSESEKFNAQALNDFAIFTTQAIAAFGAGWLVFSIGWVSVLWFAAVATAIWIIAVLILKPAIQLKPSNNR